MKTPPTLTKRGLVVFIISFLLLLILMLVNFLQYYYSDIFNKGLDFLIILKLIILGLGFLWIDVPVFTTIIAGAILYKKLFNEKKDLTKLFRKDIIVVTVFSLFVCVFATFIQPNMRLHFTTLLFNIRFTPPGGKIVQMADISSFKGYAGNQNIFGVITINDSLNNEIEKSKERLKTILKTNASSKTLDSLFINNQLSSLKITRLDLKKHNAKWNGYNYSVKDLENQIIIAEQNIKTIDKEVRLNKLRIWKMFFVPLTIILFFIMSLQLGIVFHKIHNIKLIICLMFCVAPIWYYLSLHIDSLIKKGYINIVMGKLGLLLLLLFADIFLYCFIRNKNK